MFRVHTFLRSGCVSISSTNLGRCCCGHNAATVRCGALALTLVLLVVQLHRWRHEVRLCPQQANAACECHRRLSWIFFELATNTCILDIMSLLTFPFVTKIINRTDNTSSAFGIGIGIYLGCFLPGGNSAHNTIIITKSRYSHQKITHSKKGRG